MSSGWRIAATAPLPVRPEPSLVRPLYPSHLRDRLLPDPGASPPEGTEAGADSRTPQAPSGQWASAWRGRVGPGGRCCALGLLRSVSVGPCAHTCWLPGAHCQCRGQDTREKAEWEGPDRPGLLPPRRSQRTQRCAGPSSIMQFSARCRHARMCCATPAPHPLPPPPSRLTQAGEAAS